MTPAEAEALAPMLLVWIELEQAIVDLGGACGCDPKMPAVAMVRAAVGRIAHLERVLAVERGDQTQAPAGWMWRATAGYWTKTGCGTVNRVPAGWCAFPDSSDALERPTALELMAALDAMVSDG